MESGIGAYPLEADDQRTSDLSAATTRLRGKLLRLDTQSLGLSDYSRSHLEGRLVNGVSKLNLYAYLILCAARNAT